MTRLSPDRQVSRQCVACEAGAPPMEGVTLAWMPPGWFARACFGEFNGRAGHIEPTILDPRRLLPPPQAVA